MLFGGTRQSQPHGTLWSAILVVSVGMEYPGHVCAISLNRNGDRPGMILIEFMKSGSLGFVPEVEIVERRKMAELHSNSRPDRNPLLNRRAFLTWSVFTSFLSQDYELRNLRALW